jgi:hypothetical protein
LALVADQVSVAYWPFCTVAGVALKVISGTSVDSQTVVLALAVPPVPLQLIENVVARSIAAVSFVPEVASDPDHPPEALQELAPVDDQLSVAVPPCFTEYLVVLSLTSTASAAAAGWSITLAAIEETIEIAASRRMPMRGARARSAAERFGTMAARTVCRRQIANNVIT